MFNFKTVAAFSGIFLLAGTVVHAESHVPVAITGPADVGWSPAPPVLPKGAEISVLSGNPFADGIFTLRLKMPAGYDIPGHWHSGAELVTVISGALHLGHGETMDRTSPILLGVGGFVDLPGMHPHYAWTTEATVVQIHGPGPFDMTYYDTDYDPQAD